MPTFPTYRDDLPTCLHPLHPYHLFLLTYWIYCRPTLFKAYLYQAAPQLYTAEPGTKLFETFRVRAYRNLYLSGPIACTVCQALLGLPFLLVWGLGHPIHWLNWLKGMGLGTLVETGFFIVFFLGFGLTVSVARGVVGGAIGGLVSGIGNGLILSLILGSATKDMAYSGLSLIVAAPFGGVIGTAIGVLIGGSIGGIVGLTAGVTAGVIGGIVFSVLDALVPTPLETSVLFALAFGLSASGAYGMALSVGRFLMVALAIGITIGVSAGLQFHCLECGLLAGLVASLGVLRFPFYLFYQVWLAVSPDRKGKHPFIWDELSLLPLPKIQSTLSAHLDRDIDRGLSYLSNLASNPFARPIVQRTIKAYLHHHPAPLHFLYALLRSPVADTYVFAPITPRGWADLPNLRQLILAELSGKWLDCTVDPASRFVERLIYGFTWFLRDHQETPLTLFVGSLYQFLDRHRVADPSFQLSDYRPVYTRLSNYYGGLEIENYYDIMSYFLNYQDIISFQESEIEPISLARETAINSQLLEILEQLYRIKKEITIYRIDFSLVGRQNALFRANEMLAQLSSSLEQETWIPEQFILQRIVHQWQKLVREEGGKAGRGEIDRPMVNPYIAGNPVTGDLFVGREDIMRTLQTIWSGSGQCSSVVLFGHRRVGKSSILQNLKAYLRPNQIVIDFNMELVGSIQNTGELLYLLALEIYYGFSSHHQPDFLEPDQDAFLENNPYHSFRRFLDRLDQIRQGCQLIIAIDEFEVLEELLQENRLEPQLLKFWRALFQTYQWFIMTFAGAHSLDELCRDFWSPLYGSIKLIRVGFLAPNSARILIERPSPLPYTEEAVETIIRLTNGQPYLIQLICQNLFIQSNDPLWRGKQRFTLDDVTAIVESPQLFSEGVAYFEGVWARARDSDPPGQTELLQHLSRQPLSLSELIAAIGSSPESVQACLEALERQHIIRAIGQNYDYTVDLMGRWVREQYFPPDKPVDR